MKKEKIRIFVSNARLELKKYLKTKKEIYLQQASEKVWGAYTLLIEHKTHREIRSHPEIRSESRILIHQNKLSKKLYDNASILHSYYYEGRIFEDVVVRMVKDSILLIKKELRRY